MNKTIYIIITSVFLALCFACSKNDDSKSQVDIQANQLYKELNSIYKTYADSLEIASDSALVDDIVNRLDNKIKDTYLRYPANLDTHITQSQNDTLWRFVSRIASLRSRYHKNVLKTDSVSSDSILSDTLSLASH